MNTQETSTRAIPLAASNAALKRASLLAQETAIATNTCLIIMQGGKIVTLSADELSAQKQNKQEQ